MNFRGSKMERNEQYRQAKKRVENLFGFYIHLAVYLLVNSMLFIINLLTDAGNWWFLFPLGGWGAGLFIHGVTTWVHSSIGYDWKEKKIQEYMDKDKKG